MGVNKVILIGNLGREPEVRYTQSGAAVATLALATGERRKDQTGNWVDHTEWHRLVCFGKLAEFSKNYLKKGSSVYAEGKLRTNKWQDKDGNDRYTTEILVDSLQFVGSKNAAADDSSMPNLSTADSFGGSFNSGVSSDIPEPMGSFDDDDVPF